ncbi:MAG TPA: glycoside hydrolase family 28 protein [Bacteroidales bacterium]|nr:glycoside hydrolase family 28 protein [Bacteroidales bacterium]
MKNLKTIAFLLAALFAAPGVSGQLSVKKFGAKGDGKTLDTRSIQNAIDVVFKNGGGVVDVPAGKFLIGTLILKDNVELHLHPGATLLGSPDYHDYTEIIHKYDSRTNGLYAKYFMIFAEGAENISITGTGIIDGNGLKNFQESDPQNLRPYMIRLVNCSRVTIRDVKLLESANWTLHLLGCSDVNVDGVDIDNHVRSNRDGIDIDACNRVTVANSRFNTGDDAIVLKSTNDTLCQNVAVTNCIIRTTASAVKTGTESGGGFKNITVSNCVIRDLPDHTGIELITVDGGMMQNIVIDNIVMENVASPLFIRLGNRARPYKAGQYVDHQDDVKSIYLNNITVVDCKRPGILMGLNSKKLNDIVITNYSVKNSVEQTPVPYDKVPLDEFGYPAGTYFKNLPAYGLYVRNVEGLRLQNINMYSAEGETRPALVLDRTEDVELSSIHAEMKNSASPMIYIRNSNNIDASLCRSLDEVNSLFGDESNSNSGIRLYRNPLHARQQEISQYPSFPEQRSFEDFPTELKFVIDKGENVQGLPSVNLGKEPLQFGMNMTKRGSLQLCMLVLNPSQKPSNILIKYEGITQHFRVNWQDWGWAAVTLLKEYPSDKKVDFEISAENKNSDINLSRVYFRYQDVKKTD